MSQISEYFEEMFNEHLVQEVEVQGDVTLFQICEEFGAQDEYSFLIAAGITFSLLKDFTEEDVNAILPVGATRTIFLREWRRWCRDLPEASDKIGEKRGEPRKHCEKHVWTSVELQDILNCRIEVKTDVRNLDAEEDQSREKAQENLGQDDSRETYCKPKSKLNPSYKGMLYDKYHNTKKKPGMKSKSRKNTDTTEAAVNSQEAERSRDKNQADNDVTDKTTVVIFASDEM
ncbi:hypothetical protein DMENIID0001_006680 [Sergentomyia squamirostris]